ncbi:bifunctional protein FolC family protein [Candida albicans]|uniref:Folylpolyglutamate synthase n=1 Tax=Candida albicans TaxID=5476 RepID=A0A8H6F2J2_CANAX|nr:bifunctional protein FolC family protein [Candida albicans]
MNQTTETDSMRINLQRTYKDAINALNSLQSNFASIEATKKLGPSVNRNELSINEVHEFTKRLGYTPTDFNKLNIIHITGRKVKVRERIRINGQPINQEKFAKYFFEVWDKFTTTKSDPQEWPTLQPCDQVKPMYFKYLTILSFHVFLQEGVDTAIYEVGVGGTYDSTNIIDKPTVTGISALGIDHTFMLGDNIASITENKTGIFKKGVPAFVSRQSEYPETHELIEKRAKQLGVSSLEFVDTEDLPNVKLGLSGEFQKQNAALAIRIANSHLKTIGITQDLPEFNNNDVKIKKLSNKFIKGLENVDWPEKPKRRALLFNQQGRENYAELLEKLFNVTYGTGSEPQIKFDDVIFTTNTTWSSGQFNSELISKNTSEDAVKKLEVQNNLSEVWGKLDGGVSKRHVFADIETAVNYLKDLGDEDLQVFVCGSLHLVGGFLVVLDNERD